VARITVTDKLAPEGLEVLHAAQRRFEDLEIDDCPGLGAKDLAARLRDSDALIIRSSTQVTADVIAAAARLKVIGRAGIGVDNVDVEAATRRGIVVMNTPGGNNVTTAEHTIAMMLSLARSIPQATASMKSGKWEKAKFTGSEVYNKTLGIVGLGNIGRLVAERAQGLGMKVVAFDPFITAERAKELEVELVALEELYARADFVSVHVPLQNETRNLIDAAALAKMKPTARLINCARGGIVDERALAAALGAGRLAGAALDVFEKEPPPAGHPLLGLDAVVCTPHLGAATEEAQVNVSVAIAEQVIDFLFHDEIRNAVNVPSISAEHMQLLQPYLSLGAKLGSLQAQLLREAPRELRIEYAGDLPAEDLRPVTLAILRGLLNRLMESSTVNYVNAPEIAAERGLEIVESKTTASKGYVQLITVQVRTANGQVEVAGAIFGRDVIRLVKIDHFYLEAVPEGFILMLHNRDVPGVVGAVGTLLGEVGINIAGLQLGRERVGGMAISLVHVDERIPEPVLERLRKLANIVSAELIEL
jgi:D-3-phosphoglycerate dehydrogenase